MTAAATTDRTAAAEPEAPRGRDPWLGPLLLRLHFSAGLLVGPFVLVAAVTGAVYALTPSLEQVVHRDVLRVPAAATSVPLATQVAAARELVGDAPPLVAVRPAPGPGTTTRVMVADDGLLDGQTRAVFVDPADATVVGELPVYGTSGALPLRTWVGHVHRSLGLGEPGRVYSELAASWLGVVALAGAGLWAGRWRRARRARDRHDLLRPARGARGYRRTLSWHAALGAWVLVGALVLAATGVTWSRWAGENVGTLRAALGWQTPTLDTALPGAAGVPAGEHAGHDGGTPGAAADGDPAAVDDVLAAARAAGVDAGLVEIRPPAGPGTAWTVTEIQRSYPTQADAVAVDGTTLEVVDRSDFADHPLGAKLTRWGIDLHSGALFGLANQLVLAALALGIAALVVLGYRMWWQRRPTRPGPGRRLPPPAAAGALTRAPWWGLGAVVLVGAAVGAFLPLVGAGLVAFVVVDALVTVGRPERTS